ncbi:MAG: sulfotransferase [Alphaproteobacteria bacterium]|nr:sulfotransferase [Alphaproteobacteria bacterium]
MSPPVRPDRVDQPLAPAFVKDPEEERFLEHLNAVLAPVEEAWYADHGDVGEPFPTVHVIGPPRSGTTLVTQLLTANLELARITNLAAAFWAAPVHGLRLSQKLLGRSFPSSYASNFGRTDALHEPHEFGYFWSRILGNAHLHEPADPDATPIDWQRIRTVLTHMTVAAGAPVVFKSMMLGFYVQQVQRVLPRTVFVLVSREPVDNALSVLKLRREYSGGEEVWSGLRARAGEAYVDAPVELQAASQVVHVLDAYRASFARAGHVGCLDVTYEEICADPESFLAGVQAVLRDRGAEVARTAHPLPALRAQRASEARPGQRAAVQAAVEQLLAEVR